MIQRNGFYVFTPLAGEQYAKIHKDTCPFAHIAENHIHRNQSWHWFQTYQEARKFAIETGRHFKNGKLDCGHCHPTAD